MYEKNNVLFFIILYSNLINMVQLAGCKENNSGSETSFEDQKPLNILESIDKALLKPNNLVCSVSGMDKCVRMVAYSYRFFKAFQIVSEDKLIKSLDKMLSKLSLVRSIFLRNRKWGILQQLIKYLKMNKSTLRKDFELLFKIYLLVLDSTRLLGFVIRLGLVKNDKLDLTLKKWNSDGYFLQCLVWLLFYSYDLSVIAKTNKQRIRQIKLTLIKYICDAICSYNDSTFKSYVFSNKTTSTLGVISTCISLYMSWK